MPVGTPFKKGNKGKPKGAVNKTTKLVKEVFADVFTKLQSDPKAKLITWAKANPTEFYKLASKLIPVQLSNDPENPLNPGSTLTVLIVPPEETE